MEPPSKMYVANLGRYPSLTRANEIMNPPRWPSKVIGLYLVLADNTEPGYLDNVDWLPELYPWQQTGANALFFTFIHPGTMEVPPAFRNLANTRGSGLPGSVPEDTLIMFVIGGFVYSLDPNPWQWLLSKEAAEKMAETVSEWPDKFGCDGVDLDIEDGAGEHPEAGANLVHFIRRLRQLRPDIIITQPTYGYPTVQAEIDVINAAWDPIGNSNNLVNSIGLMVYEGIKSLKYVQNYASHNKQEPNFPIKSTVPSTAIMLGSKGQSGYEDIMILAKRTLVQDLQGFMIWYASVKNGFDYSPTWDASTSQKSIQGYVEAMELFRKHNEAEKNPTIKQFQHLSPSEINQELERRKHLLQKYEETMLTAEQKSLYEDYFNKRMFEIPDPLFQSWLVFMICSGSDPGHTASFVNPFLKPPTAFQNHLQEAVISTSSPSPITTMTSPSPSTSTDPVLPVLNVTISPTKSCKFLIKKWTLWDPSGLAATLKIPVEDDISSWKVVVSFNKHFSKLSFFNTRSDSATGKTNI